MNTPTQFDTTPITAQITKLIATGGTEQAILAAVAHMFPELSPSDLSGSPTGKQRPRPNAAWSGSTEGESMAKLPRNADEGLSRTHSNEMR